MFCGDNKISTSIGETCDDGDANSGDGCSSTCQIESGFCCIGVPSYCYASTAPCPAPIGSPTRPNTTTITPPSSGTPLPAPAPVTVPTKPTPMPVPPTLVPVSTPAVANGLQQDGAISANSGNVFIKLRTLDEFTFGSASEVQNFFTMSYPLPGTTPDSKSCTQNSNDKKKFTCMLMYNGGVPNLNSYPVNISFNKDGKSNSLTVTVKPFETTFALRSLN